jgi:hypothetical protein
MGHLRVQIDHGGGRFDTSEVAQLAVITAAAIGLAVVIAEYAWLIVTLGAVAGAVRLYFHYRRTKVLAAIAAKGEQIRLEQAALKADAAERRMRHEVEVALAGRTVIQNIIDPAAIAAAFAAAATGAQRQPARVIRGEVER